MLRRAVVIRRAGSCAAGARRAARRRAGPDEAGSGTAIGMAIMFPILILVLITISLLSGSGHIDQALQSTADRAARTSALCCRFIEGPNGAYAVALATLSAAEAAAAANRVHCNNDFLGDSRVVFLDLDGDDVVFDPVTVLSDPPTTRVPIAGTVHVFLTCRVPPEVIGGFGFPGLDARRRVEGVAVVDPYRWRSEG